MEVHPPHHPLLSWRDFFIHIATIVVGLLIAIALEQSVEAVHHHYQRIETRENLHHEIAANRNIFARDLKFIASEKRMLEDNIAALRKLRAHQSVPADSLHFAWGWNGMHESAWQTARQTAVLDLFPTRQVEAYSITYGQQALVNEGGIALSRSITAAAIPLTVQPDLNALTPAQIDELIRNCAASLNQIDFLSGLIASLDRIFEDTLRSF
jgi:hypothetical protein